MGYKLQKCLFMVVIKTTFIAMNKLLSVQEETAAIFKGIVQMNIREMTTRI